MCTELVHGGAGLSEMPAEQERGPTLSLTAQCGCGAARGPGRTLPVKCGRELEACVVKKPSLEAEDRQVFCRRFYYYF